MRQATRHFMAEAAFFAVFFCVLFWVMPVQSHAADTAGKVTGFIGETYYKNGKVQKKKAVFDNGSWYVTDKSGNKVRGTTYKIRGKSYRLRDDGRAYIGAWMFGNKFYYYNSNGRLNRSKTRLLNRYCKESVSTKKKPFSKVQRLLGTVLHTWTEGGCSDGEEYYQYYYYANGFLVGTEVNSKKKSYVFVIENTPWDPSLMA